ncbi:MAG TPA: hypothetical protein GXX51_12120 [Firmicutes bacterium]|nr:hypothetical protein [Bacillota bacterium]
MPDRVPFEMKFSPAIDEVFREHTGAENPADYFGYDIRSVSTEDPINIVTKSGNKPLERYVRYLPADLPSNTQYFEWGFARIPGSMYHFSKIVHPMQHFSTPKEVEDYPLPLEMLSHERSDKVAQEVHAYHKRGLAVAAAMEMTIFELSWYLRGMEELLIDLYTNSPLAQALLDKITDFRCRMGAMYVKAGVDIVKLGDDVGTQKAMLMSPEMWRTWLKPRLRKVIETLKSANPDILVFYHSDGYIEPIIPELIEIGVDILNPLQPECLDQASIKQKFGDRLAFWGGIGTQTIMPWGTPQEVKDTVRQTIEVLGSGGGFLIAPTHVLEPEVPWENIMAFVEAVQEYGWY